MHKMKLSLQQKLKNDSKNIACNTSNFLINKYAAHKPSF